MKSWETLSLTIDSKGIAWLTLNRPEIRNAFNAKMIEELTEIFSKTLKEKSTFETLRAVVLSGQGKVFCAGGDLNWMKSSVELSYEENLKDTTTLSRMFRIMNEFPKPLIGVVRGAAIGGGVGLVSVCDIVYATQDAQFSLSEVRLGIIPACIGPFVVAKIGASRARELFVSAERFSGQKAKEIGLIHEAGFNEIELQQKLNTLLDNLVQCGPNAVIAAKKLVLNLSVPEMRSELKDPEHYVSEMLARIRTTPEGQEGVRAFLEKRKPNWLKN